MKKWVLQSILVLSLGACSPGLPPPHPPVAVDCEGATHHLSTLCDEETTLRFQKVCKQHAGAGLAHPVDCVKKSHSCQEALSCE